MKACFISFNSFNIPYSRKVWLGQNLVNWLVSRIWWKKVWRINRSANRLLIVSSNLDDYSLANHGRFTFPLPNFHNIWYNISLNPLACECTGCLICLRHAFFQFFKSFMWVRGLTIIPLLAMSALLNVSILE